MNGMKCIHYEGEPLTNGHRLCPECREAYLDDPQSYFEVGDHPGGIARWSGYEEEYIHWTLTQAAAEHHRDHNEIPF